MENVVIFGDTEYAEEIYSYICIENTLKVVAFTQNKEFMKRTDIQGLSVIPFEDLKNYSKHKWGKLPYLLICYGYTKLNGLREKIYKQCINDGFCIASFISKNALIYTKEENIAEGCIVLPNSFIGPNVKLGRCNIIFPSVSISHDNEIDDFVFFSTGVVVGGYTHVGKYSFIGLHSTLKNAIKIAEGTFVGASANVLKSTESYSIYVGNPAKKIENKKSIDIHKI